MALVVKDRVRETSTTLGTGTFTLAGAVTGFQTFSAAIGNTNTTYYTITNGSEWEVGIGTVGAGTLARTTVLASSNAGSLVTFTAGTKDVFCSYPAVKSVTTDAIGTIASQNSNNVSITGGSVAVTANPTTSLEVATKQYVDAAVTGLHVHDSVSAATTAALTGVVTYNNGTSGVGATLTLGTALTVLDGYTLLNGNRVLVKNQANAAHNGIYTWATGGTVLTRATDADTTTELNGGDFFFVVNGTVNNDTGWIIIDPVTTIGTSNVNFTQFSGAGTYTAGTGLTLTGSQFSIDSTVTTLTGSQTLTNKTLTSPTLTTPALGTPASGTLSSCTGLPLTTGITGTLPIANGGTNLTTYTTGDLVYASATNTLNKLADVATGNALISGGVGVAPSYGKIGLTTHVSGTLAVGSGGTGATTLTGIVKGNGTSAFTAATAGTDYVVSSTATNFTAQQYFGAATLTDGATISWAVGAAQVATVTIAGNRTFGAPTGLVNGGFYSLCVIQDGTGSRTITWNAVFDWAGGTAPTLSTAANAKDFFVFRSDGTNLYEQGRSLGVA
jgi:hypothetical protein